MSEAKKAAPAKAAAATTDAEKCGVEGCKRPYRAKGYCVTHYKKWRRGEIEGHRARYAICSKEGCRKPAEIRGMCAEHGRPAAAAGAEAPATT